MNIFIKCLWISVLELLKLWCPRKRAYNININSIFSPFSCSNSCKTSYTFFSGGIGTLSKVTKKPSTRSKVNYRALTFLKIRIAGFHIIKCGIKTWIHSKIELLCSMFSKWNAGSRGLCVIDKHINMSKCINCLLNDISYNSFIISRGINICLNCKNLDIVKLF